MTRNKQKITVKILVPFVLLYLCMLSVFIIGIFWFQNQNIEKKDKLIFIKAHQLYSDELDNYAKLMQSQIEFMHKDKDLQTAWLARDKKELLRLTMPIFKNMRSQYDITHFYFTGPDRVCFLRVHKPERYGDYIDRFTMDQAARTGARVHGIELGPLGTFTLRIVHPWQINGEPAGYLELGMEIGHLMKKMKRILDVEFYVLIDKTYVDRTQWEEGMNILGRVSNWDEIPRHVIIDRSLTEVPADIGSGLKTPHNGQEECAGKAVIGDRAYCMGLIPLFDYGKREVGKIIFLNDNTNMKRSLHTLLMIMIGIGGAVGGILFVFFYVYIGGIERKLITAEGELISEIEVRQSTEKVLEESERKYKSLIETTNTGYHIIDEKGLLVDANSEYVRLTGHTTVQEIRGRSVLEWVAEYEKERGAREIRKCFEKGFIRNLVIDHVDQKGAVTTVEINATVYKKEDRVVIVALCRDISERRKMEDKRNELIRDLKERETLFINQKQETENSHKALVNVARDLDKSKNMLEERKLLLEKVNKELDDFTYIISHDLKEPLRSIDAFTAFLHDDYKDKLDDEGKDYIKRIRTNAGRMKRLIEDLLELSRIDRQKNPFCPADTGQMMEEVKQRLEFSINQKQVEIIQSNPLPEVVCDRIRLTEVFANLISNAVKYADKEKPVVEIGCLKENGFYEFFVKDNGPGIEEKYFDKIFDIFQRLGRKEDHEGTGAGLAIVKKIVELHQGRVWVTSKLGEGTTFHVAIPGDNEVLLGTKDTQKGVIHAD